MRAWFQATAVGSWPAGTSRGSAAPSARSNSTNRLPSTNATAASWAMVTAWTPPITAVTAMLPSATIRPISQATIVRRRSHRSTQAPPGR